MSAVASWVQKTSCTNVTQVASQSVVSEIETSAARAQAAWVHAAYQRPGVTLGQQAVAAKTNEISIRSRGSDYDP
jgi:hypothetical protein